MKQRITPQSKSASIKGELNLLRSVYNSAGLAHTKHWHELTAKEAAIVRKALIRADKLRIAAWDPGAAYMSGVMDMLMSLRKPMNVPKKTPKIRPDESPL